MATEGATVDWEALDARLAGEVVLPGAAAYESARQLQHSEFDAVRPRAVVRCATEGDVRAAVDFARENGLPLTPRSGRHSFTGWSTTTGLVLDLERLDRVTPTGAATVLLGPGAQSVDVVEALAPHGLQVATGICPTVCAGGYLSGGGIGFQARAFGVASDRLVSARVVLADGRAVRCSAEEEPELFWALRGGGGGNFGVVTEFEVRPTTVPVMTNFTAMWGWDQALDVMDAWPRWLAGAPRGIGAEVGVFLPDAAPSATPVLMMVGAHHGPRAEAEKALGELSAASGAAPQALDLQDELPYAAAMMRLYRTEGMSPRQRRRAGDNPEAVLPRQGFVRERHRMMTGALPRDALAAALTAFDTDRCSGQLRYFAFTALGGAVNETPADATAYVHRDTQLLAKFTLGGDEPPADAAAEAGARAWVDRGFDLIDPHSNGHCYINTPDPDLTDWQWAYYGTNYPRLVEAKRTYDPHGLFRFPQGIGG
ncbi:putative FAD-linked oxidoreductase YvdP [Streptomyces sp. enrichment culture]|uniref:FAD-binding oxidoreductase n=1 Tax=Streptomyces sp. enrichment culture TaxID=1795815 RepID=UPI003F568D12